MSHIEFYDTYVHNVAIIFYIFDFIKVFRQTDVPALSLRGRFRVQRPVTP